MIRRATSLLAVGFLVSCTAGPDGAGGAARFTPAQLVSTETANGATPMLAVGPQGQRVLSWVADGEDGGPSELHVRVESSDGRVVTRSVLRDPFGAIEPHGEAPPQLAMTADGEVAALYTVGRIVPGRRFPASALRLARTSGGGAEWATPQTVNEGEEFGSNNFHALLAAPDGRLYATWLSAVAGNSGVWLRRSDDGGVTWGPSRPVYGEPTCPCCRTAIAVGPRGELYVAWRAILPGDVRDIVVMRSDDFGDTWTAPTRPAEHGWVFPGCPHAGPSMRVDAAGVLHIAWWTGKEGKAGVWYASSADGGETFTAAPVAVGQRSTPAHVQLALAPSGPVVAWDDGLGAVPGILVRRMGADAGQTVALSAAGQAASYPVLGVIGDSLLVAWSQMTTAAHHAASSQRPDMTDPTAVMPLPRVGQSEIFERRGPLQALERIP